MGADYQYFLEQMLRKYGLYRVILVPYSLLPIAVGLGFFRSRDAALFAGTVVLFFVTFVVLVSLIVELRQVRKTSGDREVLVNRYGDLLLAKSAPFRYRDWEEHTEVGRNGDAVVEWFLTLEVTKRTPVHLAWLALYKSSTVKPVDDKLRRKLRVTAMEFEREGTKTHFVRRYWATERFVGSKLGIFVHFVKPLHLGDVAHVYIRWTWPRYYDALVAGGHDVVEWSSLRAHISSLRCDLYFSADCGLKKGLAVTPYPRTPQPRVYVSREGVVHINLEYRDVPADLKKFGLELDASRNTID